MKISVACFCLAFMTIIDGSAAVADDAPYRGGFQYQDMGATPSKDDSLYRDLGGKEHIAAFVDDFINTVTSDDRIKDIFGNSNLVRLKSKLTEQFIDLSGGPVKYSGQKMANVHKSLDINDGDFNALVEDLQMVLDRANIPFATQNRLLALLAPMHRDIVTK